MAEHKDPPNPNLVHYPNTELSINKMSKSDRLKHLSSIVNQDFHSEEDFQKYLDSTRTKEQKKLVSDVISAFNQNCKQNNQDILIEENHIDFVIFLPEQKVQQISQSEDIFSRHLPPERQGKVLAKVLKSGVVLMSAEPGAESARDSRSTLAHEFGHVYRLLGDLEKGSENDLEEPIVEHNSLQVSEIMGIKSPEHYGFELKLIKALSEKFKLKSFLDLSFDDLTEIGKKYYPGEKEGHPNFVWLVEDYLDLMHHIRRNTMLHSYSKEETQQKEYVQKIFDEIKDFGAKWELDMFIK